MSKGMQQRLGLAQALMGSPRLLLLDEPTSALDPAGRRTVRALLEQLRDRGVSVLLNSAPAVGGRAGLRPGRDHRPRRGGRGRHAGELSRPGGVEVETAAAADVRRRHPRRRAADRARAGRRRRGGLQRPCYTSTLEDAYPRRSAAPATPAEEAPRGVRPAWADRGGPRAGELRGALIVARFSLRESLRRRVFVVVGLLTLPFLALYGLATWQAFEAADEFSGRHQAASMADRGRRDARRPGDVRDPLPRHDPGRVPHPRRGPRRRGAGLLQPLLVRPLARRTLLLGRWLGRPRRARRT